MMYSKMLLVCMLAVFMLVQSTSIVTATVSDPLQKIILEKQEIVENLAIAAKSAFDKRCDIPRKHKDCIHSSCESTPPVQTEGICTRDFGANIFNNATCDYKCPERHLKNASAILTSKREESEQVQTEKCWTLDLEDTFKENFFEDRVAQRNLRWQYIGTTNGLTRIYPYFIQQTCHTLDPRVRPWYVSATSGPKTILLVLDVSASMLNYGRLELAKDAANTVVGTLTNVDYVGIVLFGDNAEQLLLSEQEPGKLVRATTANITALQEKLKNVTVDPLRGTNFEAAFEKVFDILDNSVIECHSAILFLTDGHPNKGLTSQYRLTNLVSFRNRYGSIIFTYSLGSRTGAALLRGIACESQGVYSHIVDGGELRQQLSQYYDYFASQRVPGNDSVTWVEPYEDAAGAGLLVTVSKAVYDYDNTTDSMTPRLIGVVGADILVDDLRIAGEEAGLNYADFISRLASNNKCPLVKTDSPCLLKEIRSKGGSEQCDEQSDLECFNNTSNTCTIPTLDYCDHNANQYVNNSALYFQASCCHNDSSVVCDNEASQLHCCLSVFYMVISVIVYLCQ